MHTIASTSTLQLNLYELMERPASLAMPRAALRKLTRRIAACLPQSPLCLRLQAPTRPWPQQREHITPVPALMECSWPRHRQEAQPAGDHRHMMQFFCNAALRRRRKGR